MSNEALVTKALKLALEKIARVNACDYEYQAWAREALNHCEDNLHMVKQEQDMPKIGCVNHDCEKCKEQKQKRPQNCGTSYCSCIECVMDKQEQGEPLFWYKPLLGGKYCGPIHNAQIGDVLRGIEEWAPLYTTPQPKQEQGEQELDLSKLKPENQQQIREWIADGSFAQRAIDTMFELSQEITELSKQSTKCVEQSVSVGEPVAIKHRHEWFRTGEMKAGQMRCISCGTWGQEDMPQQRPSRSDMTWIGLTAEDIDLQAKKDDHAAYFALGALWAEAVLKEKNT